MTKSVLFYVSGHGFGHAVRSAEVIRALVESYQDWSIHVRTQAPASLFALPQGIVSVERVAIDKGVAELQGGLEIDHAATLKQLREAVAHQKDLVVSETEFVRNSDVSLIVADVPYLAGEIASRVGIPCIAIANFTWDWIYESFLEDTAEGCELMDAVRSGYARMQLWLRLPFHHANGAFSKFEDVSLIARRPTHDQDYVLDRIGIPRGDTRPRVLVSSRGPISPEVFCEAVKKGNDLLFLHLDPACRDLAPNSVFVQTGQDISFIDLAQVCSVVFSKLGYGILSDCIAVGPALLYPPREGFREDELLRSGAAKYVRAREIPAVDFRGGHWASHIRSLLEMQPVSPTIETNGADVCAEKIARYI